VALSVTSEVRKPYLDGKNGIDVSEVTAYFKFQALPNSCVPTCIHNVLKALAASHRYPPIALSERRVNQLCRYRLNFGPIMNDIVSNMKGAIRSFGYAAYAGAHMTYGTLAKVIDDKEGSYPVIELSHKYLDDRCDSTEDSTSENPPDHVVIVLCSDPNETIIFDPFDTRNKVMRKLPDRIGRGLYLMPTGQIMEYWDKAFRSWAFWIGRLSRKTRGTTRSTVLEQYPVNSEAK